MIIGEPQLPGRGIPRRDHAATPLVLPVFGLLGVGEVGLRLDADLETLAGVRIAFKP